MTMSSAKQWRNLCAILLLYIVHLNIRSTPENHRGLHSLELQVTQEATRLSPFDPWQCNFEDDFLVPLYKSERAITNNDKRNIRLTMVSEFFQASEHVVDAILDNLKWNKEYSRFIFLIGESQKKLSLLKTIIPSDTVYEVYYAPGGVTYRHLFAAAALYPETFLIHNADIAVGNMSKFLNACNVTALNDVALMGSRLDVFREGAHCQEYRERGSFDTYISNRKTKPDQNYCVFLNNLRFPPYYWGAENVVASQIPKTFKANLCPFWNFSHYHPSKEFPSERNSKIYGVRPQRIRINFNSNSLTKFEKNDQIVGNICDLNKLQAS